MRTLKLFLILGLVAVMTDAMWAITYPPAFSGSNFTFVRNRNEDNGNSYNGVADGVFKPASSFTQVTSFTTGQQKIKARGAIGTETNWGLFITQQLVTGAVGSDGITVDPVPHKTYYDNSAGTNSVWLVGMFYGGVDQQVAIKPATPGNVSNFEVVSTGLHLELWAVNPATLSPLADSNTLMPFNAASRTAANSYTGWLDAAVRASGTRLMTATSDYNDFDGFETNAGKFDGQTKVYFNVDASSVAAGDPFAVDIANHRVDGNGHYLTPTFAGQPVRLSDFSDMFFTFTDQGGPGNWDTQSSDQGGFGGVNVPEPLTMLGVFMGVSSLGTYVRRRFA
jgi:hypothetical protein